MQMNLWEDHTSYLSNFMNFQKHFNCLMPCTGFWFLSQPTTEKKNHLPNHEKGKPTREIYLTHVHLFAQLEPGKPHSRMKHHLYRWLKARNIKELSKPRNRWGETGRRHLLHSSSFLMRSQISKALQDCFEDLSCQWQWVHSCPSNPPWNIDFNTETYKHTYFVSGNSILISTDECF